MSLTNDQIATLEALAHQPRSTRQIVDALKGQGKTYATYDAEHSRLRHLEDRSLVRRVSERPVVWELTGLGRTAIR